jgi:hypothetical protein
MTTLTNDILIRASRQQVWHTLATLDRLAVYDPGTKASTLIGDQAEGIGARRRCDVAGGWFVERVAEWQPVQALAFELETCTLPVKTLRHDYRLAEADGATKVTQVMTYELKYKAAGRALDAVMLRRKWDQSIKTFLRGLKEQVEARHLSTPNS